MELRSSRQAGGRDRPSHIQAEVSVIWTRSQQVRHWYHGRLGILWVHSELGIRVVTVTVCQKPVSTSLGLRGEGLDI